MKKKRVLVRLPSQLHSVISKRASQHLRSINSELIVLLKRGLVSVEPEAEALSAADKLLKNGDSDLAAADDKGLTVFNFGFW